MNHLEQLGDLDSATEKQKQIGVILFIISNTRIIHYQGIMRKLTS